MKIAAMPRFAAAALGFCLLARHAAAQTGRNLALSSLEDLMKVEITSAARTEQRVENTPAAVFVITQDDIRRAGMTTLPDVFRLVPGMQVAQITGNKWAVSARGFNDLFSNKLLVLIDGRSIYNRAFSGVFWEDVALPISDVERIEVVRGPGGSVWGANAVNAVINIVTKSAADSQGVGVIASGGSFDRSNVLARYGGTAGSLAYRAYGQSFDHASSVTATGADAGDSWTRYSGGGRIDWTRGDDSVMAQAGATTGHDVALWREISSPVPGPPSIGRPNTVDRQFVLGRWTRAFGSGRSLQTQAFYTHARRHDGGLVDVEHTSDVDLQYQTRAGAHHTLVVGGGMRDVLADFQGIFNVSMNPSHTNTSTSNVFAQDLIEVSKRLRVTAGSKLEHDSVTGWNVQPTLRGVWTASSSQWLWAAVSRAVRTPSRVDRQVRVNVAAVPNQPLPILISLFGNLDYRAETLVVTEAGYRLEPSTAFSFDLSVYRGAYRGLQTNEPLAPFFEATPQPAHLVVATQYGNLLNATATGVELSGHWVPRGSLRVDGSYTGAAITPHPDPATRDPLAAQFDGNVPSHQWQLHASTWIGPRVEANAGIYYTGRLKELDVPAYSRTDARLALKLSSAVTLEAIGQNLFNARHAEFSDQRFQTTMIPRSARLQLRWNK